MGIEIQTPQFYSNYDSAFLEKVLSTIAYMAQDVAGNIVSRPVPTVWSTPERAFASVARQIARRKGITDITDEDIKNIPLPIIAVYRGIETLDTSRFIQVKLGRLSYNNATQTFAATNLPQPYDLTYQVDIWARTIKDMDYIKNQFLQWLRCNEFYLHVDHPMPFGPRIVLTEYKGMVDSSSLESQNDQRTVRKTLTFNVHGWLCTATDYAPIIKRAVIDINDYGTSELLNRIVVTSDAVSTPEVPVITEGVPTVNTTLFAAFIPGAAQEGLDYGHYTIVSSTRITGMQASVNGNAPQGSDLILQIKINGLLDTAKTLTILAGELKGSVSFAQPLRAATGDVLQIYCQSAGAAQQAEWVDIQYNAQIETSL